MKYPFPIIIKHRDMETKNPRNRGTPDAGFSLLRGFYFIIYRSEAYVCR